MRVTATSLFVVFLSSAFASPLSVERDSDDLDQKYNIFEDSSRRYDGAICKNDITVRRFPHLNVPNGKSGCVRYFQGIDMTGVVTEVDLYAKDGIHSACDCIAACLERPLSCTNWVYKHTFVPSKDGGKRSCTLYSSPNLPTNVTLDYNLDKSTGFSLLQPANNPQAGGGAPLTFLDANGQKPDPYGVSGFMTQDQNNKQYC